MSHPYSSTHRLIVLLFAGLPVLWVSPAVPHRSLASAHELIERYVSPVGPVIYVDVSAAGAESGASWEDALNDLQDAFTLASRTPGRFLEIWVAAGTYRPGLPGAVRESSFRLRNNTALYGGFAGGETDPSEREYHLHVTILSGDLNGDDGPDFANNGDNSYHVVTTDPGVGSQVVLDGFVITGGNGTDMWGGGASLDGAVTVANCTFVRNAADGGGGLATTGRPVLTNCIVSENLADYGGGMISVSGSPTLSDCTFIDNAATGWLGGGMLEWAESRAVLDNCTFTGNSADNAGGGGFVSAGDPTLSACTFSENTASYGGGVITRGAAILSDCLFEGNWANTGGGMLSSAGSPLLTNCTFSDNTATDWIGGGMLHLPSSHGTLVNCVFVRNSARFGGGIAAAGNSTFINCTLSLNSAETNGGGGLLTGHAMLANCIVYGNKNGEILSPDGGVEVRHSCVQSGLGGAENVDVDPKFVNPAGGDLRLSVGSPCIDAGDNKALPAGVATDLDGHARITNGIVDMGAYESAGAP